MASGDEQACSSLEIRNDNLVYDYLVAKKPGSKCVLSFFLFIIFSDEQTFLNLGQTRSAKKWSWTKQQQQQQRLHEKEGRRLDRKRRRKRRRKNQPIHPPNRHLNSISPPS